MRMKIDTKTMVKAAFLVAISVILTRFFAVMLPIAGVAGTLRFGFGMVPIMLAGLIFGPIVGGVVGLSADLIGVLINPQGAFFIGFTISSILYGVIPGLLYVAVRKINNKILLHVINAGFILLCTFGTIFNTMTKSDISMENGILLADGTPVDLFAIIGGLVIVVAFIAIPIYMTRKNVGGANVAIPLEKLILIATVTYFIVSLGLNTLWLSMMFDKGFLIFLPGRVLAGIIQVPINATLLYALIKYMKLKPEFIEE